MRRTREKPLHRISRGKQTHKDMPGRRISNLRTERSVVLYGRSGTGKTTLACSFPKPLLLLDISDEGTDSISDVKDVEAREMDAFGDIEDMYWWLKDHPDEFSTVVIDTVSQLQQMAMKEIMGGDTGRKGKKLGDWGSMSRREFGDVSMAMKDLLQNYRDLTHEGMNVVFIAQDRVFNFGDEDSNEEVGIDPEVGPMLYPSVAKALNASVSVIGNTLIREKVEKKEIRGKKTTRRSHEFCLRIGPSSVYATKIRKPRSVEVPSFIVDPTYEDIMSIIKGE